MFRYLLPLALCCALLAAASAHAIELDSPVVSCSAKLGSDGPAERLTFSQADDGSIELRFTGLPGDQAPFPMLYTEPGLIVARQGENLLVLHYDLEGRLYMKSTRQRSDGSPDTKASFYFVDCGTALHF